MIDQDYPRVVIDTNVYISSFLRIGSTPARAVLKAEREAEILVSAAVAAELASKFKHVKFDKYVTHAKRETYLRHILEIATFVEIPVSIRACRDPRDDKFLEVAVHGRADLIVTGDSDLLALHPFQGIAILTPAEYLEQGAGQGGIL
jgi:putative PIN family toxin of toxin-antitoxin system